MLVAVVALAGTAIYAALDHTILTKDGYVLPGSSFTYHESSTNQNVKVTIAGYDDGNYLCYITESMDLIIISESENDINELTEEGISVDKSNGRVDVPGLGVTESTTYSAKYDDRSAKITYILGGLLYSADYVRTYGSYSINITDSNAKLGTYNDPNIPEIIFKNGNNSLTVSCICKSVSDGYMYKVDTKDDCAYYIGNKDGVPLKMDSGTSKELETLGYSPVIITIANNSLSTITYDGVTYSK